VELEALQDALPKIEAKGATLVAISPMVERFVRQVVLKNNLTFDLLLDKGNAVAEQFGIVHTFPDYLKEVYLNFGNDFVKFNGDDSWTLPMPARYVIDREGIIRAADVNPDYTVRPEPYKTIADLNNLDRG
jgi:peroxiredoxin